MNRGKLLQLTTIVAFLVVGSWSFLRLGGDTPESAARQQTLQQLLAPAGPAISSGGEPRPAVIYHAPVSPVAVNLAEVPAGEYHAATDQYERWLRGEIDLDEQEEIVSAAEMAALRRAA